MLIMFQQSLNIYRNYIGNLPFHNFRKCAGFLILSCHLSEFGFPPLFLLHEVSMKYQKPSMMGPIS